MIKLQQRLHRPATERGFTLIELLVVIIILGILAAVVVFAVSGVGDKGKSAATTIDDRTIRTAEEAYCAKNGKYASGQQLVTGGFLSELPEYHEVNAQPNQGGPCNGWKFSILRTAQADPYPVGRWDLTAAPAMGSTRYAVQLMDGKILAGGSNAAANGWATQIWDPMTSLWTTVDNPPDLPGGGTAILLKDDPTTPRNECSNGVVNNCGKVFLYGRYLFTPNAVAGSQWQDLSSSPNCSICGSGPSNFGSEFTFVQMKNSVGPCGTTCGKIYMFLPSIPELDVFDPSDNTYTTTTIDPEPGAGGNYAQQLADGRVLICCRSNSSLAKATFFDPASLTFTGDAATPPSSRWVRGGARQPGPLLPNGDLAFVEWNELPRAVGRYIPEPGGPGTWRTPESPSCVPTGSPCRPLATLADGRILSVLLSSTRRIYVYNPAAETWTRTPDLTVSLTQSWATSVLLDPANGPCGTHCGKVFVPGRGVAQLYTP